MNTDRLVENLHIQKVEFGKLTEKLSEIIRLVASGGGGAPTSEILVNESLRICEKEYLRLKENAAIIADKQDKTPFEIYGTSYDFEATIEYMGNSQWKLHLPIFSPISVSRKKPGDGKYIYYLVYNLLDKYWNEHKKDGTAPTILKDPVVVYEYHIKPHRNFVFDYDNVDSKSALDAMQGFFLTDDSAFSLTVIQSAVKDEESYTDIYILEKPEGFLH